MARHPLEVADVVRAFGGELARTRGLPLPAAHRRVLNAIAACRTQALGGHVDRCDRCAHELISYNSCRNRHCPKCQASARREWLRRRESELLPVPYFHVVFTLPQELRLLALHNPRVVYKILFRASSSTLRTIAADPRHLGAEVGILSILHTWGQSLEYHPHVHCVVTGGGLSSDGSRWIASRPGFFLPVRVLSRLYRGKVLDALRRAHRAGKLRLRGKLEGLADPVSFQALLRPLHRKEWVVYSKAPFGGPGMVLKYLGRYTHRVAISNQRLVGMADGKVSFVWKDYAHGCKHRVMSLSGTEFLRRFLMHVLPKGFVRIRHSGLLANAKRSQKLERCRQVLSCPDPEDGSTTAATCQGLETESALCPACKQGHLVLLWRFESGEEPSPRRPKAPDSS